MIWIFWCDPVCRSPMNKNDVSARHPDTEATVSISFTISPSGILSYSLSLCKFQEICGNDFFRLCFTERKGIITDVVNRHQKRKRNSSSPAWYIYMWWGTNWSQTHTHNNTLCGLYVLWCSWWSTCAARFARLSPDAVLVFAFMLKSCHTSRTWCPPSRHVLQMMPWTRRRSISRDQLTT